MKSEIGEIVRFYRLRKLDYENFLGKGVLGKRLQELLNQQEIKIKL